MDLSDLEPEWITPELFIFKNPTGGKDWLTCKSRFMSQKEQRLLVYGDWEKPETKTKWVGKSIVTTDPEATWWFSNNDFETITTFPSIDASASGNWHGFITNGKIITV